MSREIIEMSETDMKLKIPKVSPLGHEHNEVVTYTNPKDGYTATFRWDGLKDVYYSENRPNDISPNGAGGRASKIPVDKQA